MAKTKVRVAEYDAPPDAADVTALPERQQLAALPYVIAAGRVLVCLATSRETRRWIIPKGWPRKGTPPHLQAAAEAMEEAGLEGVISPASVGSYSYEKRMPRGPNLLCRVTVFPMLVTQQSRDWPERKERELSWLPAREAATRVDEPELSALIASLDDMRLRAD